MKKLLFVFSIVTGILLFSALESSAQFYGPRARYYRRPVVYAAPVIAPPVYIAPPPPRRVYVAPPPVVAVRPFVYGPVYRGPGFYFRTW
jgi:hypothetical protein